MIKAADGSVSWWGLFITLIADATAFVSLIFAYFFYASVNAAWPPVDAPVLALWPAALVAGLALASWALMRTSRAALSRAADPVFIALGVAGLIVGCAAFAAGFWWLADAGLSGPRHAYDAILWVTVLFALAHFPLAALMTVYAIARNLAGKLTARFPGDLENVMMVYTFALVVTLCAVAMAALYPLAA